MEFRVLGPVEVYDDDGRRVEVGGPRQRAVLARLLVSQGGVVSTQTLIEDVYGSTPPVTALPTVQSYVSHLRRAIERDRPARSRPRVLVGRPPGYVLVGVDVDAGRFADLVRGAEFLPAGEALVAVEEALGLWRGVPYGEFCDESWALGEVARLRELRLVAVERRARALLDLGRPQVVIADLEVETRAEPLRERLWCLLALALYHTGRQADALTVLRNAGDILLHQHGLDPGQELRALEDDILRQVDSLAPVSLAALLPPEAPPSQAPAPNAPPGREDVLAELLGFVRGGVGRGVGVAGVSGEAGIGKSCVLEAFAGGCVEEGFLVVWGRCHDTEGTPVLWPWLQVLGVLEGVCEPPDRGGLGGLLDGGVGVGVGDGDGVVWRNRVLARWLVEVGRVRPLVIVFDDFQWADVASLELLRDVVALVGGMGGVSVSVVVGFRDGVVGRGVEELLGRLGGYGLRVRLGGLGVAAVGEIARGLGVVVDEGMVGRLAVRTGGNPFFVRESVRLLGLGRSLDEVPDAVAGVVRQRLGVLGVGVGEALRIAAVIGRAFDPSVVAEVGPAETYELLDEAAQAGVIVPQGTRLAFTHDLVRETLLRDLPPFRRAGIHRDLMAALSARPGTDVETVAYHAVEAGPAAREDAVRWARAAAEQAGMRLAYEEAAAWWASAIKAHDASGGDPETHVDLLLRQVRALLEAGDAVGARRARADALRAADRAPNRPDLATRALAALDAPALWTLRDPYEAVELHLVHRFETALERAGDRDGPQRARLLAGLAQELYDGSGDPRSDELSAQAVEMARRLGDPHLLMRMLNARHLALPQPLHIPELMKIADELHELAADLQAPAFELLAQMMHTHYRLELFDVEGADRAAARSEELLERLPLPWPRFQHTMWRANRFALEGRFDDAETLRAKAGRQAGKIGVWHAGPAVAMGRLASRYQEGTIGAAGSLIDEIEGIHPTMDHDARILQLCAQGRREEARALVARGWPSPPLDWSWLSTTCLQAAARAAVGSAEDCRAGHAALLPYGGRISTLSAVVCMGPVDWYLALLASAAGDQATAARHLDDLRRLTGRSGLLWWHDRAETALRALPPA